MPSLPETVMAVEQGMAELALVPIENSIEGTVNPTLDTLVGRARETVIVGETVLPISQCLIAARETPLEQIEVVLSMPAARAQCARFLHRELPRAEVWARASTADAVREVSERGGEGWAALGTALAAEVYGGTILRRGVEDEPGNETRFVWLAAREGGPGVRGRGGPRRTALVFWGPGDTGPGWLVGCLDEFARRGLNLSRIESRPRRVGLGHYLFLCEVDGDPGDSEVHAAIAALERHCEQVRLLGSYAVAPRSPSGDTDAV